MPRETQAGAAPTGFALLDALPVDVVLLILEQLGMSDTGHRYTDDPANTLLALCGTARRYRDLAQPLLWRRVILEDRSRLDKFRNATSERRLYKHVRQLVVTNGARSCNLRRGVWLEPQALPLLLPLVPHLETLAYDGCLLPSGHPFDIAWLSQSLSLRQLSLTRVQVLDSAPGATLPLLEQLRLDTVQLTQADAACWLNLDRLPTLRVVFFRWATATPFFPITSPSLLSHLEFVHIAEYADNPIRVDLPPSPPILIETTCSDSLPRHAMLDCPQVDPYDIRALRDYLESVAACVRTAPPGDAAEPASLWLQDYLQAASEHMPLLRTEVEAIAAACRETKRRLMWWSGREVEGELVSHAFWRFLRGLKHEAGSGEV